MDIRMFVRVSLSAAAVVALVAACSSDPDTGVNAQIKSFCQSYAGSPAFSAKIVAMTWPRPVAIAMIAMGAPTIPCDT